jgi:hypothetical protein
MNIASAALFFSLSLLLPLQLKIQCPNQTHYQHMYRPSQSCATMPFKFFHSLLPNLTAKLLTCLFYVPYCIGIEEDRLGEGVRPTACGKWAVDSQLGPDWSEVLTLH